MSFFKDLFAGKKARVKTPEERKAASIQRLKKREFLTLSTCRLSKVLSRYGRAR